MIDLGGLPSGRARVSRARLHRIIECATLFGALLSTGYAQTPAAVGCPVFHCTPEATGVMPHPIVQQVTSVATNSTLGYLKYQGCSGDGLRLNCLFSSDKTAGVGQGTLKMLDANTLQPIWGSAGLPNSYDLVATQVSGQVPVSFADGRLAAGDASFHVLYAASGAMLAKLPVGGKGTNFGMTPISGEHGVISQLDGVLTLVDVANWQNIGVLELRDPDTNGRVTLVSPSAASGNTLYAVAFNELNRHGFLFAVAVDPSSASLIVRTVYVFSGRSGASPVVVTSAISGLAVNLVLLHAPGVPNDRRVKDRLVALLDHGFALSPLWTIALAAGLPVSPTIDRTTQTLYFVYREDKRVFQHSLLSGAALGVFDIQAIGGLPSTFMLNGHLIASQDGPTFTLLLSGSVAAVPGSNGQYALAFKPNDAPRMVWAKHINNRSDVYTAAWNLAPARQPGAWCPIVVGSNNGITRLCDFAP